LSNVLNQVTKVDTLKVSKKPQLPDLIKTNEASVDGAEIVKVVVPAQVKDVLNDSLNAQIANFPPEKEIVLVASDSTTSVTASEQGDVSFKVRAVVGIDNQVKPTSTKKMILIRAVNVSDTSGFKEPMTYIVNGKEVSS